LHGIVMIFLVVIPVIPTVFGHFLLPIQIGARAHNQVLARENFPGGGIAPLGSIRHYSDGDRTEIRGALKPAWEGKNIYIPKSGDHLGSQSDAREALGGKYLGLKPQEECK